MSAVKWDIDINPVTVIGLGIGLFVVWKIYSVFSSLKLPPSPVYDGNLTLGDVLTGSNAAPGAFSTGADTSVNGDPSTEWFMGGGGL